MIFYFHLLFFKFSSFLQVERKFLVEEETIVRSAMQKIPIKSNLCLNFPLKSAPLGNQKVFRKFFKKQKEQQIGFTIVACVRHEDKLLEKQSELIFKYKNFKPLVRYLAESSNILWRPDQILF